MLSPEYHHLGMTQVYKDSLIYWCSSDTHQVSIFDSFDSSRVAFFCPGRFLGIISEDPSDSTSNRKVGFSLLI